MPPAHRRNQEIGSRGAQPTIRLRAPPQRRARVCVRQRFPCQEQRALCPAQSRPEDEAQSLETRWRGSTLSRHPRRACRPAKDAQTAPARDRLAIASKPPAQCSFYRGRRAMRRVEITICLARCLQRMKPPMTAHRPTRQFHSPPSDCCRYLEPRECGEYLLTFAPQSNSTSNEHL